MLEALTADVIPHFDVLGGADRSTAQIGRTEHHLLSLLEDRSHVVWRALLDSEGDPGAAPVLPKDLGWIWIAADGATNFLAWTAEVG